MISVFTISSIYSSLRESLSVTRWVLVCAAFIVVGSYLLPGPRIVRGAGTIIEYPIPTASIGNPTEIMAGSDGNLWYLESTAPEDEFAYGQIHRMSIQDPISFTSITVPGSTVSGIASGKFGEILFAEFNRNKVGRIFPTSDLAPLRLEEIDLLSGSGRPWGVAVLDDAIWFTQFSLGQIGRISSDPERTITYFDLKTPFSYPSVLTVGPDDKSLYFIIAVSNGESITYSIGRITVDGAITEFPIPDARSRPHDITAGPDGNVWFTDPALNSIWRLTPEGGFSSFTVPTEASEPMGITAGPDAKLYFTETKVSKIGIMTSDGVITGEIPTPTLDSGPCGITVGSDGNIWFVEGRASKVGRLELSADLGLNVLTPISSAGRDRDIPIAISISNRGPDSVANASVSLGRLLPYYSVISCDPGAAGGLCLAVNDEVPDYWIRVPFIPSGGSITAQVVVRIRNCSLSPTEGVLPDLSSAISVSSRVPDRISENNIDFLNINASPPARITVMDGSGEIRLGPVVPGISTDPNAPTAIFRLENTGCVPLRLTVDSLRRIPIVSSSTGSSGPCGQPSPGAGDDFKFFEIRTLESTVTLGSSQEAETLGEPLRNGMQLPVIQPGESLGLRAQFKAQLPGFISDNPLSTDYILPDQIGALLTLSQPELVSGSAFPASQTPLGPPTKITIKGLISPVVQIIPRDPIYNPLVQMAISGDKFEVRLSAFDAKLNVRRATYQFFDQSRQPVTAPINVSLEDAICQKRILSGQSFTVLTRFTGAANYPEIAHVQVTIYDDEGSSTADSFPNSFSSVFLDSITAQRTAARNKIADLAAISPPIVELPSHEIKARKPREK
jgi:streptogramin lyase